MLVQKIRGLAVPYNKENSYRETLKPGALERCIPVLQRVGCPMLLEHEACAAGVWYGFEDREDGLYICGVITDPNVIARCRLPDAPPKKLSITYRNDLDRIPVEMLRCNRVRYLENDQLEFKPIVYNAGDIDYIAEISLCGAAAWQECYFELVGEPEEVV